MGTVAVGAGIFQGKNNSGKSTWDSPHAFFKMTYAAWEFSSNVYELIYKQGLSGDFLKWSER